MSETQRKRKRKFVWYDGDGVQFVLFTHENQRRNAIIFDDEKWGNEMNTRCCLWWWWRWWWWCDVVEDDVMMLATERKRLYIFLRLLRISFRWSRSSPFSFRSHFTSIFITLPHLLLHRHFIMFSMFTVASKETYEFGDGRATANGDRSSQWEILDISAR